MYQEVFVRYDLLEAPKSLHFNLISTCIDVVRVQVLEFPHRGIFSVLVPSRIASAMLRLHSFASSPLYSLSFSSECTACSHLVTPLLKMVRKELLPEGFLELVDCKVLTKSKMGIWFHVL